MLTDNILLKDLKDKLETHHKEVESLLRRVASRQKWIILGIVLFNAIIFIILQLFSGESGQIISGIDNTVILLILTVAIAFIPFPDAIRFGQEQLDIIKFDIDTINPRYDYNGRWGYNTLFQVDSEDDNSNDYKILHDNMNNFEEEGTSVWKQDALIINIEHAYTSNLENQIKENRQPSVDWRSSPIALSESSVEWHFEGSIKWKNKVVCANKFVGSETYDVVERDSEGRPIKLIGNLIGYVHIGTHCYNLSARTEFKKQ